MDRNKRPNVLAHRFLRDSYSDDFGEPDAGCAREIIEQTSQATSSVKFAVGQITCSIISHPCAETQ